MALTALLFLDKAPVISFWVPGQGRGAAVGLCLGR